MIYTSAVSYMSLLPFLSLSLTLSLSLSLTLSLTHTHAHTLSLPKVSHFFRLLLTSTTPPYRLSYHATGFLCRHAETTGQLCAQSRAARAAG